MNKFAILELFQPDKFAIIISECLLLILEIKNSKRQY